MVHVNPGITAGNRFLYVTAEFLAALTYLLSETGAKAARIRVIQWSLP